MFNISYTNKKIMKAGLVLCKRGNNIFDLQIKFDLFIMPIFFV